MSTETTEDDLKAGPPTTLETDALLDVIESLPPATHDQGNAGHELARASARRAHAVRLRLAGLTYDQIARECGYSNKSAARQVVIRALTKIEAESVGELRALENARLDADERVLRGIIGGVNNKPADRIKAIDSRLRLSARRARLNGLDAPLQVALSAGVTASLEDALAEAEALIRGEVLEVHDEPAQEA